VVTARSALTRPIDALLDSLRWSLTGSAPDVGHPVVAAAFGAGSTVTPVDVGSGLWAVLRAAAGGGHRVLCVHNVTDVARTFAPHVLDGATPLFLSGETSTTEAVDGLRCELRPHGFVWLGTRSPGEDTR